MNGIKISNQKIIIELSFNELGVINNSLYEVCNKIESWEFETRMGADKEDVKRIFNHLTAAYVGMELMES